MGAPPPAREPAMSQFLDEAMGVNRLEQQENRDRLLDNGQADDAYDDFFANRPDGDGVGRERSDTTIERLPDLPEEQAQDPGVQDPNAFFGLRRDQGDDEVVRVPDEEQVAPQQPAGGGLIQPEGGLAPLIERRPSIDYSTEAGMVDRWMPRSRNPQRAGQARSNNVLGKYWRTFGERKAAIGGGIGGFFGALFGGGMKRANALAGARNRRAAERAGEPLGLQSAMRSRLANEGSARADDIKNYPREPGVNANHKSALKTRKAYNQAFSRFDLIDRPNEFDAKDLGLAHGEYDLSTGTRSQPLDAETYKHTPDKFSAISKANDEWGDAAAAEQINPHAPKPRLQNAAGTEKRVRFMDGANDEADPVSQDPQDFDPKPRPTGVKFHPIPLMGASREGMTWKQRRATAKRERAQELTDDEALGQEQMVWPLRNRLSRMDPDRLEVTALNASAQANRMQQDHHAPDSPEAAQMRELATTGEVGFEVVGKRMEENNNRARVQQQHFPTKGLNKFQQMMVTQELMASGDRRFKGLDNAKALDEQMDHLPARYFKNRYWNAFDARHRAEQPANDSVVGEDASDAGNGGQGVIGGGDGGGGVGGGAGLIQEEPEQPSSQMHLPHEAWHVVQQ